MPTAVKVQIKVRERSLISIQKSKSLKNQCRVSGEGRRGKWKLREADCVSNSSDSAAREAPLGMSVREEALLQGGSKC